VLECSTTKDYKSKLEAMFKTGFLHLLKLLNAKHSWNQWIEEFCAKGTL